MKGELIHVEKRLFDKKTNTEVQITEKGRIAIEHHWMQLEDLRKGSQAWKP